MFYDRGNFKQTEINLKNLQSVNAAHRASCTTAKYNFIPTSHVVNLLEEKNWLPVKANEVSCRKEERKGFQKHLIRFRHKDYFDRQFNLNDILPEVVLTNSHDGLSSFQFNFGLFRVACLNGLIVCDTTFQSISVRHLGFQNEKIYNAVYKIVEDSPKILNRVQEFKNIQLTPEKKRDFLEQSLTLKYDNETWEKYDKEGTIKQLSYPKRNIDIQPTLWNTFNIVQEKFINGNKFLVDKDYFYRVNKVRQVKSITENLRINKGLWELTEKFAQIN